MCSRDTRWTTVVPNTAFEGPPTGTLNLKGTMAHGRLASIPDTREQHIVLGAMQSLNARFCGLAQQPGLGSLTCQRRIGRPARSEPLLFLRVYRPSIIVGEEKHADITSLAILPNFAESSRCLCPRYKMVLSPAGSSVYACCLSHQEASTFTGANNSDTALTIPLARDQREDTKPPQPSLSHTLLSIIHSSLDLHLSKLPWLVFERELSHRRIDPGFPID